LNESGTLLDATSENPETQQQQLNDNNDEGRSVENRSQGNASQRSGGLNTTGGVSFTLSAGDTSTIGGLGEVSDFTYNAIALTLHTAIVGSAMFIEDVGILFDFISTFGITLLMYILPAAFLLLTMQKFQRKS
jgi:hypothetical protein